MRRCATTIQICQLLYLICCVLPNKSSQSEDNDGVFSILDGNEQVSASGSQSSSAEFDCSKLNEIIVNRYEWNARGPSQRLERFRQTPTRVFVHSTQLFLNDRANKQAVVCQTDSAKCAGYLRQIQAHHQLTNKWPDIGYNYLIAHDGTIYEGLGASSQGFHTANYNNESLGIAFIGDYQATGPNGKMVNSLIELTRCLVELDHLEHAYSLHGHRDARCTPCPGRAAYARLRSVPHFRSGMLPRFTCLTLGQSDFVIARKRRQQDDRLLIERSDNQRGLHVAAISKGTQDKQLILINMPPAQSSVGTGASGQQRSLQPSSSTVQLQPALYLLTTTKTKTKLPSILLLNSAQSMTESTKAGGGDDRGGNGGRGGQEQSSGGSDGDRGSSGGGSPHGDGGNNNDSGRQTGSSGSGSDGGGGGRGSQEGGRGESSEEKASNQRPSPGGGGGGGNANGGGDMMREPLVSGRSNDLPGVEYPETVPELKSAQSWHDIRSSEASTGLRL